MARRVTVRSWCLLCAREIAVGTSAADHLASHGVSEPAMASATRRLASHTDGEGFTEDTFMFSIDGVNVISRTERSEPLTAADAGLPVLGRAAGGPRARP